MRGASQEDGPSTGSNRPCPSANISLAKSSCIDMAGYTSLRQICRRLGLIIPSRPQADALWTRMENGRHICQMSTGGASRIAPLKSVLVAEMMALSDFTGGKLERGMGELMCFQRRACSGSVSGNGYKAKHL